MTTQTYSRELIREWSGPMAVGIWNNESWSVRLYKDRAIVRIPYVRWVNDNGSLAYRTERLTGHALARLLEIAAQELADDADYTGQVKEIIWDI